MGRDRFGWGTAMVAGLLVALLLWGLALGTHIRRHEPGLWTVRFDKLLSCGLDYNGPPFAAARSSGSPAASPTAGSYGL